ncbi:MAG: hypothetical protein LBL13_08110 [Bacteroidales bacterium]|jgi:hypothetical protein|nr:hypothetical protein [Bacteroidales bacterium]
MYKRKSIIYVIVLLCALFVVNCTPADKNNIEDPIDIYSIAKNDTSTENDIVTISGSNPIEVRKRIAEYVIPETSFEAKRKTFYNILDTIYLLKTCTGQSIYNVIDSLNYMAVHYLTNILMDKKSLTSPLKHKLLKRVSSYDKAINVYSWEEYLGVDMHTNICVFQYMGTNGRLCSIFNVDDDSEGDFNFSRSRIMSLYKLSSESGNPLYLANFMGNYGNKNHFKGSTILEIRDDELFFDYDAFGGDVKYFFMNYTDGEILTTLFSYKSQELKYIFKQLNVIVETRFIFNGQTFERQID